MAKGAASTSPAEAEQLLDSFLAGEPDPTNVWSAPPVKGSEAGRRILALKPAGACVLIRALLQRLRAADQVIISEHTTRPETLAGRWTTPLLENQYVRNRLLGVLAVLLVRNLSLAPEDIAAIVETFRAGPTFFDYQLPIPALMRTLEFHASEHGPIEYLGKNLAWLKEWLRRGRHYRDLADRLDGVLGIQAVVQLYDGEAWSDAALADLAAMRAESKTAWETFLLHCQEGGKGNLNVKWRKASESLFATVEFDSFKDLVLRWFPLVDKPRTQPIARQHAWEPEHNELLAAPHVELLRGLVWCCGLRDDADLARALMRLALSAYRKIPGKGPRLVSLGNACVTALGTMSGRTPIGQLALLKVKVKFGTAQKEIDKAFNAAAAREGLPRDEIEELAVPSYGLEEVGHLHETFGVYKAELVVDGSAASLLWSKEGKPIKSVPAAVKKDHGAEFKELQATLKDVNAMLPAQRDRIDTLFLAQKSWPLAVWRERYLDHPLVGTIARRLIWSFNANDGARAGIWCADALRGVDDAALDLPHGTTVALWHPIGRPVDEVVGWREWLERREIVQPFKQAHREVYLLTDAERRTGHYSNRFAAHILRQHQYHALCAARGWRNRLRLMVDDTYPPTHRLLPGWNLRAEFWVEGAGYDGGLGINDAGVYLYLTTDQVRFYALNAAQVQAHAGGGGYGPGWNAAVEEPVPLEAIPPLVFSEIMRDVDLFVGVASVGNDPNWADGGPDGQHREYWNVYSWGELNASAHTRRALLERLLPRLKIADRCTLADRFLHVRGNLRTYKIHLGSSNILMSPNDQYLCIVPRQTVALHDRVFLPFEGDQVLSVILSKAFLLADDTKIADPSIVSQLQADIRIG